MELGHYLDFPCSGSVLQSTFGDFVHGAGANLHFDAFTLWSDEGCMQRLIGVFLRPCDVVFEPISDRLVNVGDNTVDGIAILVFVGIKDDPNGKQVV